jgi:uncharacterized protein YjiS (DUF1127 family)
MTEYHSTKPLPEVSDSALDRQIRSHVARAKTLRAEAVADTMVAVWQGLARGLRACVSWLALQRRRARTRNALMACSDRTLADIGIPRGSIDLAVRGVDLGDPLAVSEAGLWPHVVASVSRTQERRRRQLRIRRELMAYSDRELEEIGLRRIDIPTIARAA